jgi:4-hydroxy-2-oxoheptanedioate aldolase
VQVPHVITKDDARAAVDAVKFHPMGRRSLAAGTRASGYGYKGSMGEFTQAANKETLVAVQIEDEAALTNIDAILEVAGIDVFFIGPSDLSASMGHPGAPKAAPVAAAIDRTIKAIVAAGKTPGMPATRDNLAATIGKGARYIYTHTPTLLGAASADFLKIGRGPA